MEIKAEDLKNYIGVPVCYVHRKLGYKNADEEWCIVKKVTYSKDAVGVYFTDGSSMEINRDAEHTELFITV